MFLKSFYASMLINPLGFCTKKNRITIKCNTDLINRFFLFRMNRICQKRSCSYTGINRFLYIRHVC